MENKTTTQKKKGTMKIFLKIFSVLGFVLLVLLEIKTFNMSSHIRDLDKQVSTLQVKLTSVESGNVIQENQIRNLLNLSLTSQNYYQSQIDSLNQQASDQQGTKSSFQQQLNSQQQAQQQLQNQIKQQADEQWQKNNDYQMCLDMHNGDANFCSRLTQ